VRSASRSLLGGKLVGIAYPLGHVGGWDWRTEEDHGPPEQTWWLVVGKEEVEGRFVLRGGRFVELAEDAGQGGVCPVHRDSRRNTATVTAIVEARCP
jgi:hypothetical protein